MYKISMSTWQTNLELNRLQTAEKTRTRTHKTICLLIHVSCRMSSHRPTQKRNIKRQIKISTKFPPPRKQDKIKNMIHSGHWLSASNTIKLLIWQAKSQAKFTYMGFENIKNLKCCKSEIYFSKIQEVRCF